MVVEPFEFGPTVQRAVLPLQDYAKYPKYTKFLLAGWGEVSLKPHYKDYSEDLLARIVTTSSYPVNIKNVVSKDYLYILTIISSH